jgi:opacity protein-like surface antigen
MRSRLVVGLLLVAVTGLAAVSHAEDTDRTRFYFGPRLGLGFLLDKKPVRGVEVDSGQQLTGFVGGVNLSRYLGVEVAADAYETDLNIPGVGKIGEYGMFTLLPQVRLRYPVLDGRLTPYVVAGVGLSHTEFNDRKPEGIPFRVDGDDTSLVGAAGVGFDYFVAHNIAAGVEAKYVVSRGNELEVNGVGGKANLDALLTAVHLRLLVPDEPAAAIESKLDRRWRVYLAFRLGGAALLEDDLAHGIEGRAENAAFLGDMNLLFGVALGVDLGRHVSIEIAGEGYEPQFALRGVGVVREYAIYNVLPQLRLRYPVLGGRLSPYLLAGAGISYAESNDAKPRGVDLGVKANDYTPVGALGVGLDYFVAGNIAVGLESKYVYSRDHEITIYGTRRVNLDSILTSIGVRVFFR